LTTTSRYPPAPPEQIGATAWYPATLDAAAYTVELDRFVAGTERPGDLGPAPDEPVLLRGEVGALIVPAGFDRLVTEVGRRLTDGPGFAVVKGFPVDGGGRGATQLFASLMSSFGKLLAQDVHGDLLHLVRTTGLGDDRQYGSKGSGELLFHTDQAAAPAEQLPGVLGLLALQRAARGGHTRLVSGHTLLNELRARDGALAASLCVPSPFARDNDGVSSSEPVEAAAVVIGRGGRARIRFNRYFMETGARRIGVGLVPGASAALDAIDELFDTRPLDVELLLEPGDALVADNSVILHNRTAYQDDRDHVRCLVRAWAH
jgi:hypothetical protein